MLRHTWQKNALLAARIAEQLISRGADVRARNRRGAEPLHYLDHDRTGNRIKALVSQPELGIGLCRGRMQGRRELLRRHRLLCQTFEDRVFSL
jgi:hypothetical protein